MTKTLIKSSYGKPIPVVQLPQIAHFHKYERITLDKKIESQKFVRFVGTKKTESDTNQNKRHIKSFDVSDKQSINLERFSSVKELKQNVMIADKKAISENQQDKQEETLYDKFTESGLIGSCSIDEDLSTTYKQVLSDSLDSKYNQKTATIQEKLKAYPDWDREEQIKRNQKALKKLKERQQKTLQIDDQEACQREEDFERFKQLIDQFRPQGSKLYSED